MPYISTFVPGRVIAMSVSEDVDDYDLCMASHCTDYIMKPPRASELKLKLASLMKRFHGSSHAPSGRSVMSTSTDNSMRDSSENYTLNDEAHGGDNGLPRFCEPSQSPNYAGIFIPEPPSAPPTARHRKIDS